MFSRIALLQVLLVSMPALSGPSSSEGLAVSVQGRTFFRGPQK